MTGKSALERLKEQRRLRKRTVRPLENGATVQPSAPLAGTRAQVSDLSAAPDILRNLRNSVSAQGFVGEGTNASIIYLAVTTRLFDQPVSIAVKGPSSSGKSSLVNVVLAHFPEDAWYELSSMSEHALIYLREPLKNRFLVIHETAGLAKEQANYLTRVLLSEGRLRHSTVRGGKEVVIEREGPTGLITTTTAASLHPENETRMLSVTVRDTPEQTRAVLVAQAAGASGTRPNLRRWHKLQRTLERLKAEVSVPFAQDLALLIPPVDNRLRRDFPAIMSMTKAHALIHWKTRNRDESGKIVAKLKDYAAVRRLIGPIVAEGVEATIHPDVRETVEAVRALGLAGKHITIVALAEKLIVDKGTASRRTKKAISQGFIVNQESRSGHPARLAIGDQMSADQELLPVPSAVLAHWRNRTRGASS